MLQPCPVLIFLQNSNKYNGQISIPLDKHVHAAVPIFSLTSAAIAHSLAPAPCSWTLGLIPRVKMESTDSTLSSPPTVLKLKPIEATPESFEEFGQVIEASPDGDEFGPHDAQLDLSHGTPRFYIMHLEDRALKFSTITHHWDVTQCLGSIGGHVWYLGVAKPSIVDPSEIKGTMGANIVQSHCGHFYVPPPVDEVRAFRISGSKFLKLNRGTWHAGPLFTEKTMDFYNLELSNTNVVDHTTHDFIEKNRVVFSLDE